MAFHLLWPRWHPFGDISATVLTLSTPYLLDITLQLPNYVSPKAAALCGLPNHSTHILYHCVGPSNFFLPSCFWDLILYSCPKLNLKLSSSCTLQHACLYIECSDLQQPTFIHYIPQYPFLLPYSLVSNLISQSNHRYFGGRGTLVHLRGLVSLAGAATKNKIVLFFWPTQRFQNDQGDPDSFPCLWILHYSSTCIFFSNHLLTLTAF